MLKLILGLMITALSTLIGKRFTNKYKDKYEFYKAYEKFNSTAIRNLNFRNGGIRGFYKDDFGNKNFNDFLGEIIDEIDSEAKIKFLPNYLTEREKNEIVDYFTSIGRQNFNAEMDLLERTRVFLDEKIKELKEQSRRYSSLGAKLGFTIGMTTMIIIL
ncbi:MAG: hypothetical protein IJ800_03745 [Clostridia bacterium]|nr:hypothetical protein [Clostridia bacterium]